LENLKRKNNLITVPQGLPFKEIMELINAKHGFYYSKDSRKKLNRYTGKVSRRIIRGSKRQPQEGRRVSRVFRSFIPKSPTIS
jgi:hypothetical protein